MLGMRPPRQEFGHDGSGSGPDGLGPLDQARGRPCQILLMRRGEMRHHRRMPAPLRTPHVAGHTLIRMEALDRRGCEPDVQRPVHQGGGDAVIVPLDLHMRIDIDPGRPPLGIDVRLGRQRLQRGPIHRVELGLPTAGKFLEGPAIQPVQTGGDRRVELGQAEEGLMPQTGQDPPFDK